MADGADGKIQSSKVKNLKLEKAQGYSMADGVVGKLQSIKVNNLKLEKTRLSTMFTMFSRWPHGPQDVHTVL